MARFWFRKLIGAGALCVLASCTLELSVPPEARIACGSTADCPSGLECSTAGRCVPEDRSDRVAPFIEAADVTPEWASAGTVTVELTANEPLALPPTVELNLPEGRREFGGMSGTSGDVSFTSSLTLTGNETEGVAQVLVSLTDLNGNRAEGLTVGSVTIDFTDPFVPQDSVDLQRLPTTGPLETVDHSGPNVRTVLSFAVSEPVGPMPAVTTGVNGQLDFARVAGDSAYFVYELHVSEDGTIEEEAPVVVDVIDRAGNRGRTVLDFGEPFVVDNVDPGPPAVGEENAIILHRFPWGAAATGGTPQLRVTGAEGSVEANATVVVYAAVDGSQILGEGVADGSGAFGPIDLFVADRTHAWLSVFDRAGNASSNALVRDVRWTATLGGKVAGSTLQNPHDVRAFAVSPPGLETPDTPGSSPEQSALAALLHPDTSGVASPQVDGTWSVVPSGTSDMEGRSEHGFVELPREGVLVALGGQGRDANPPDEWEFSTGGWSKLAPRVNPFPRRALAAVYDAFRDRVVLFGGTDWSGSIELGDHWELVNGTWTEIDLSGQASTPRPRWGHSMVFDPFRSVVLLYGGVTLAGEVLGDVWQYDGHVWSRLDDGNSGGPKRQHAGVAFDTARDRMVVFGGWGGASCADCLNTFEWAHDGWINHGRAAPITRRGPAMAYDPVLARTVLVGGAAMACGEDSECFDTWEWDGDSWRETTGTPRFTPRRYHGMTYSSARGAVIMHGGQETDGSNAYFSDLWQYEREEWTQIDADPPPAVVDMAMAQDPQTGRIWMHGGSGSSCDVVNTCEATRLFSGGGWQLQRWSGPVRERHAMAYYPPAQTLVLFGGYAPPGECSSTYCHETWLLDTTSFSSWALGSSGPTGRRSSAMAWDPARGRIVMFGGFAPARLSDTWEYRPCHASHCWIQASPDESPPARAYHAMAFDPNLGEVLLFGGDCDCGETWSFNGSTWIDRTPSGSSPEPRSSAAMTTDYDASLVLLYGGDARDGDCGSGVGTCNDLWAWGLFADLGCDSDPCWKQLDNGVPAPTHRENHGLAGGATKGFTLLFGGRSDPDIPCLLQEGNACADTWRWRNGALERPGVLATFQVSAAGMAAETLLGMEARAHVSGIAAGVSGAELGVWDVGRARWQRADSHTQVDAQDLVAEAASGAAASGWIDGQAQTRVIVRTRVPGGGAPTTVDLSYIELTATFRHGHTHACGNGYQDVGELCDDGDTSVGANGCSADCDRVGTCGDGVVQSAFEACEPRVTVGCNAMCELSPTCAFALDGPGCADRDVEACVCAHYPGCCDRRWTRACVDAALTLDCF